jgi:hypothetical protein
MKGKDNNKKGKSYEEKEETINLKLEKMNNTKRKELARFTNDFARNAEFAFTDAKQLLLFLSLVSQTNPYESDEDMTGILSVQEIAKLTKKSDSKKSGSLYSETKKMIEKMMQRNYVRFSSGIVGAKGSDVLDNYQVIFDRLRVIRIGDGTYYEYRFHSDMRQHIKDLKDNFVSLMIPRGMKSGHSIRFLMLAKAHHNRFTHKKVTSLEIAVTDLKRTLGIEGKYPVVADLKRRVINPVVAEINNSGLLYIKQVDYLKTFESPSANISGELEEGEVASKTRDPKVPQTDANLDLEKLKQGQYLAYNFLVEKGCYPGIAYKQIVEKMPSEECTGWEDIYIELAWKIFEDKTKYKDPNKKAGAFVKWWSNGEFQDRHFSEIIEKLISKKKKIMKEYEERFNNREEVKEKKKGSADGSVDSMEAIDGLAKSFGEELG